MASGSREQSLYLIDAHALIFQVFHAIRDMSSPSGLPTNALFGFTRDLMFLRTQTQPEYLVCVFDAPGPTFREAIDATYKANRGPMPDDLQLQIPHIHQLLDAMRIPVLSKEGFEADDIIATVAVAGAKRGLGVYICSSDKDCRQLLSERIRIYNLRKHVVFDRQALLEDWGVTPEQVVDFQTLVGDSVDNVRGVPGIGEKTAAKLLQDYQTLENLLAHVDQVPGVKRQENLRAAAATIENTRKLVRLDTNVPIEMDWDGWRLRDWDAPRLLALFRQWGFRGFAETVREMSGAVERHAARGNSTRRAASASLFNGEEAGSPSGTAVATAPAESLFPELDAAPPELPRESRPPDANWQATYHLVDTREKFEVFRKQLLQQKRIAFDLETTSLEPRRADVVGYAFCWKEGEAYYLPVRAPAGEACLEPKKTLAALRPVFEKAAVAKVNQNIKYDLMVLRQQGVDVAGVAGDPMVADYLLHAGERSHNMEVLARDYLHHQVIPITDLIGKRGKNQLRMDQVPAARVAEYSGEDADVAWRLTQLLEMQLRKEDLHRLYAELEVPLIKVLAELEFNGIRLDLPRLQRLSEEMAQQLADIEKDIYRLARREFNIASLKQLRQVLFDELQLPVKRKTGIKGEASTDQETLEWLAQQGHELPKKLLEHRRVAKLKGTYVDALPALVNPDTGRIHASFNQTVAATGRLSASDPNLQNIPIRSDQGGQIRQAFLPEEGWLLLTADYSQVELRLLAHFSGDDALRRAFAEDRDIHASVAAQIFAVPESEVTAGMRRLAKVVNFGVIYGISPFGLGQRLEMPKDQAARFIDAYFAQYPKVLAYQDEVLKKARQTGQVGTILGRRRKFDPQAIRPDSTYQQRNQAEREAINMEIQGSAADLIKVAMVNLHRRLKQEKHRTRMLLQIHDELVFETPPEELDAVATLVRHEMSSALADRLTVPLKVDVAVGPNWLDVKEVN
jgi:DNA polymerase-1